MATMERILLAAAVGAAVAWPARKVSLEPVPASDFDPKMYMGRWYQTYDNLLEQATFENASLCDTADYALLPNGTITVLNRERILSVDGPERALQGYASCPPGQPPACTVTLDLVPLPAPYYIVALGDPKPQGPGGELQYPWAVVSDPLGLSLFVLARNVTDFYARYDDTVMAWTQAHGFTSVINTPLPTVQEGCTYWD